MAQVERGFDADGRMRMLLRQRPGLMLAVALTVGLLMGAAAFGVYRASAADIEIERFHGGDGLVPGDDSDAPVAREGDLDGEATGPKTGGEMTPGAGADEASVDGDEPTGGQEDQVSSVVVDVAGAVRSPAVVTLREGDRVQDAIDAAGGLAEDADSSSVNRAAKLVDGQQVYIPRVGERGVSQPAPSPGGGGSPVLVNINSASVEELDTLSGVGPSTAQAIVEDREANGPFTQVEDLMRVSGIGEKKFEQLKSDICV